MKSTSVFSVSTNAVPTCFEITSRWAVFGVDSGHIYIFNNDDATLKPIVSIDPPNPASSGTPIWALCIIDNVLISGYGGGLLYAWDITTGAQLRAYTGHNKVEGTIRSIKAVGSSRFLSASRDHTVRVWDLESENSIAVLHGHTATVRDLAVQNNLVVSAGYDGKAFIWDLDEANPRHVLTGESSSLYVVAINDKQVIAGGRENDSISIWNSEDGSLVATLHGHTSLVSQLIVQDGLLYSAGADGKIISWDSKEQYKENWAIQAHENSVTSLQALGEHIISGSSDGSVKLWDKKDGSLVTTLIEGASAVWKIRQRKDSILVLYSPKSEPKVVFEEWQK